MKVLLLGARGQLGNDLCRFLNKTDSILLNHSDLEVTDIESVRSNLKEYLPEIVVHTAAYVRVDDCEINQDIAFKINAFGTQNMAIVSQEIGAKLIYISTDYVFDGENTIPYRESAKTNPINIYGKSKLAGEKFVQDICEKYLIVRGSGLFGIAGSSGKGGNFVETILNLGKIRNTLSVVNDQIFSPTYTVDMAQTIMQLISSDQNGIFHFTNSGSCSWFEFAAKIIDMAKLNTQVIPISSQQYQQKAKRPKYSVLDNHKLKQLGFEKTRSWETALAAYFKEKGY